MYFFAPSLPSLPFSCDHLFFFFFFKVLEFYWELTFHVTLMKNNWNNKPNNWKIKPKHKVKPVHLFESFTRLGKILYSAFHDSWFQTLALICNSPFAPLPLCWHKTTQLCQSQKEELCFSVRRKQMRKSCYLSYFFNIHYVSWLANNSAFVYSS